MSTFRIGIDLGTTYSLVAALVDGTPRVLPNNIGEALTASAVFVDTDGTVLVGDAAKAKALLQPERGALVFKRDMGTSQRYTLGEKVFTPEELSALVLQALKRDAEAALGGEIEEAVVTVPAYFGELQRRATRDAAELAGLRVERIINEPTAAALAYGLNQREREFTAVVLDLGGGTFDVTVLDVMEGVIEVQASAGDTRLGGEDFLDALVALCTTKLRSRGVELSGRLAQSRLRTAAEEAKCRLSSAQQASLALPALSTRTGTQDIQLDITRAEAEAAFQPLLDRMLTPIQRALRDCGRSAADIQDVLLVGGASRMPSVARLASQVFGKLPLRSLHPDEAIALGAAVQVALKAGDAAVGDIVVTDIAPFSLGIASAQEVAGSTVTGLFSPILERGTVLPASRVERFHTMSDGQTRLELEVFQGEHSLCEKNLKIGSHSLRGIPAKPAGIEAIDVRFSYDLNGVLDVDATIVSTNKTATFTIERTSGKLSAQEIAESRKRLARLKFHPSAALPNMTALSRAEALYVELSGAERELLGKAIAAFRAALQGQQREFVDSMRGVLIARTLDLSRRD
jgi:molecular chaperone HscC